MIYKLKDICSYRNEKIYISEFDKNKYVSTDNMLPNFGGAGELKTIPNNCKVNKYFINDILLSNIRPYFKKMMLAEKNGGCSSDVLVLKMDVEKVNPKYLYYRLMVADFFKYVVATSRGTKMPRGDKKAIMNYELNLPPLQEQKKIVSIFEQVSKKIELNNKLNNNLYEICNSIYHSFLDKYSNLIIDTKLVDIAKKVITGKTPSTKNEEFWNGNIPFITIPDMHNQVFTINTERTISKLGAKSIIPKNSIAISCIATVGLVSITTEESQTNQQINSIIINNDYDLYYLFEFLSEQAEYLKNIAGGSTTYNINKKTFENIVIPYLPENLLKKFNDQVSCLFERIKENQIENKNLEQLRDTLLPKLMNGEINLDNVEI